MSETLSQVAAIILSQLGGSAWVKLALGVKFYQNWGSSSEKKDGIGIRYASNLGRLGNHLQIILAPNDTYTLVFYSITKKSAADIQPLQTIEGVYVEDLLETIYQATGLSLYKLRIVRQ